MTRPKTKGEPVQFRLPVELDQVLKEKADAKGQTRSEYVATLTANFLSRSLKQ